MSERRDGWANVLTGLGVQARDKRLSAVPMPQKWTRQQLEDLFRADDIARKVVARIPKEMFREGYEIKVPDTEGAADKISKYLKRLDVDTTFRKAIQWARLHGGAGVILGVEDGIDPSEPVNWKGIRSIKYLAVLDRWELQAQDIQRDLTKPDYGLPLTYTISANADQSSTVVHSSRVIRFDGIELPENSFTSNNYWGDSVLSAMFNPLLNFNSAHDSSAHIMQDFAQAVFKLKNLTDMIASGDDDLVMKRLQLLDAARSVVRAIVIQDDEEFRRETTSLTGVPELLNMIGNRLVAASDMPHTVLLGEGSQGNTSGRSEQEDFYNMVSHEQQAYLKPRMFQLIDYVIAAKDSGLPNGLTAEDVEIKFFPLWSQDEAEAAQTYKARAEGDALYITNGVLDPDEVALSRFGVEESEIKIAEGMRSAPVPSVGAGLYETTEPAAPVTPSPSVPTSEPGSQAAVTSQEVALNGAQVTSLVEVITAVAAGALPRDSGIAIIQTAFALAPENAEQIMGTVGRGFAPKVTVDPSPAPTFDGTAFFRDELMAKAQLGDASEIQSIIIEKEKYSDPSKAAAWIVAHGFANEKIDPTGESFRFRQREPEAFAEGSLKTIELVPGIKAVVGQPLG